MHQKQLAVWLSDCCTCACSGDVYSFGIIISEVLSRQEPYSTAGLRPEALVKSIAKSVYDGNVSGDQGKPTTAWSESEQHNHDMFKGSSSMVTRPALPREPEVQGFCELARSCWDDVPKQRPAMPDVLRTLLALSPQKGEMVDNLIKRLEK